MNDKKRSIAIPLVEIAYLLHENVFNVLYPCPLQVKIKNCRAFFKLDSIFHPKYIPFLLIFVLVTSTIIPGSSIFLLLLKLFKPDAMNFGGFQIVVLTVAGSCTIYQAGSFILYYYASEIEVVTNQMFLLVKVI